MRDNKLMISTSLITTAGAVTNITSTNVLDMGPLASGNLFRNFGASEFYLFTRVETTALSTGSATLTIKLTGDNNSGMTSTALIVQQLTTAAVAGVTAGTIYKTAIPRGVNMERYWQVENAWATAPISAGGLLTQWVGPDESTGEWYAYNKNAGETTAF